MSVMLGTEIEPLDGAEYEQKQSYDHAWWYIQASQRRWIHCTPDHHFYDGEGIPRQAQDFEIGDIIRHRAGDLKVVESGEHFREATKVKVIMDRVFLYWANGFLSLATFKL